MTTTTPQELRWHLLAAGSPSPRLSPSSVPVHLVDSVDTSTVLLALEDSRDALRLSVPPDAYPADHVITLGETDYPVPADGVIADPTLTATILSSREYTDFVRSAPEQRWTRSAARLLEARRPHHRHGHPAVLSDRRRDERVRL